MPATLFRDCLVLRDARGRLDPARRDILVDDDRIAAIEPDGRIMAAEESARPVFDGVGKAHGMALDRSVASDMTRTLLEDHARNAEKVSRVKS